MDNQNKQYSLEDVLEISRISVELGRDIKGIGDGGYGGERKTRVEALLERMKPYREVFKSLFEEYKSHQSIKTIMSSSSDSIPW